MRSNLKQLFSKYVAKSSDFKTAKKFSGSRSGWRWGFQGTTEKSETRESIRTCPKNFRNYVSWASPNRRFTERGFKTTQESLSL